MNKRSKITLYSIDVLAGLVITFIITKSAQKATIRTLTIAYVFFLFLIIAALVVVWTSKPKIKNLFLIASTIYTGYSVLLAGITWFEKSWESYILQVLVGTFALVGINIAALKPNDDRAFAVINLLAVFTGLVVIGFGVYENNVKHSKVYNVVGGLLIAVAAVTSNLSTLGVK